MRKSELGSRWPVSLAYVVTSRSVRDLVSKDKVDSVVGRQYLKLASGLHMHTCTRVHHHRHEYRHTYIHTLCFEPTVESLRLHISACTAGLFAETPCNHGVEFCPVVSAPHCPGSRSLTPETSHVHRSFCYGGQTAPCLLAQEYETVTETFLPARLLLGRVVSTSLCLEPRGFLCNPQFCYQGGRCPHDSEAEKHSAVIRDRGRSSGHHRQDQVVREALLLNLVS